jgi:hypothetical protein
MTVRIYRSDDASAPVLTGQAGSLITVLDAILVNGYGAKTAAGWTKPLSTTNKAAYLQNTTGANNASGMYLYVDDTAPTTAKEARVCGFETMSAITPTGTGQFPTGAQSSVGVGTLVVRKSTTADSTARAWVCIANGQTIYFFADTGDTIAPQYAAFPFIFGDFKSYKAADSYAVCIIGRTVENSGSALSDPLQIDWPTVNVTYMLNNIHFGHFVARHWSGAGGSIKVGKMTDVGRLYQSQNLNNMNGQYSSDAQTGCAGGTKVMGRFPLAGGLPYPNGPDGALWASPIFLNHNYAFRGYLTGLWAPLHDRPLGHKDTASFSAGNLNGKSIIAMNIPGYISASANGDTAQVLVETSDTWA